MMMMMMMTDWPRGDVAALSQQRRQREPQTVVDVEVVREAWPVLTVLDLPLGRTEPADEKQDETDAEVGQDDAEPDVAVQRVHEREDARLLLLRLLDHDADAELHERLAEVDDSLSYWRDCQRRYGNISLLDTPRVYYTVYSQA